MLNTEINSANKTTLADINQFFTFWDMDDTSIFWEKDETHAGIERVRIKNPHLLLPVLLFQTFAPNQHVGIMTNRPPSDNIVEYTVKMFIDDLHHFGIHIPEDQIIFCGGENASQMNDELKILRNALDSLPKQLQSLKLIESGEDFSQQASSVHQMLCGLDRKKYDGKNYFIIKFLNEHFQEDTQCFNFKKGICARSRLILGIVDDYENIAKAAKQLGAGFFSILASRGGNAPKDRSTQEDIHEYYRVDYFDKLAEIIGLNSYCENLLTSPEKHLHDHPMLQLAALLFLWQRLNTRNIKKRIIEIEKQLSDMQCEQIAKMLENIMALKISHPEAQYKPVEKLAEIFSPRADRHFLNTVIEQLRSLENRIVALASVRPVEEAPMLERSKSRTLGSLFRNPSRGKSQTAVDNPKMSSETIKAIKDLELKKNALVERLKYLSSKAETAELANSKLMSIFSRTNEEHMEAPPARSFSAKAFATTTAASSSISVDSQRRSYTPAADSSASKMRTTASAGSLEDLEASSKVVKKVGSNIN